MNTVERYNKSNIVSTVFIIFLFGLACSMIHPPQIHIFIHTFRVYNDIYNKIRGLIYAIHPSLK